MKTMINDLELKVYSVYIGDEFSHNVAGLSCNVVIKRNGEFYEVAVNKKYEFDNEDIVNKINNFYNSYLEECDRINSSWKLVEDMEGLYGRVIGQTKIEL